MTIEAVDGKSPIQLKWRATDIEPEEIFETPNSVALSDFGIAAQALLVKDDALRYAFGIKDISAAKCREASALVELGYKQLEEMLGKEIPRGEQTLNALRSRFDELVSKRVNSLNGDYHVDKQVRLGTI